jgi:hypothetical protein
MKTLAGLLLAGLVAMQAGCGDGAIDPDDLEFIDYRFEGCGGDEGDTVVVELTRDGGQEVLERDTAVVPFDNQGFAVERERTYTITIRRADGAAVAQRSGLEGSLPSNGVPISRKKIDCL